MALALVASACSASPPEPRDPALDNPAPAASLPADTAPSASSVEAAPPPEGAYLIRAREPSLKPSSPPAVSVSPPTVGPSMSPALVRHVVHRGSRQDLHRCYEKAIAKSPTLAGQLRVAFTIGASGDVQSSTIEPPGLDKDLDACVADALRRLRFPAPSGGGSVRVVFPMEFRPE